MDALANGGLRKKTNNDAKFQLWQAENHFIELATPKYLGKN